MKVLVTGAAGQLGSAMAARLRAEHDVLAWMRGDIDLTHHRAVSDAIDAVKPNAIVNCASFNHVDLAEDDQVTAMDVNAIAVGNLARAAARHDALLVHYSTDFVFAGTSTTPYTEADRPEPRSVYSQSKLLGEWLAVDAPQHYILRVESLFGGPHRRSSIDRIADAVAQGGAAPVFIDRVVSPSFVSDVVDASMFLMKERPPYGLYHCVNSGHATWFEIGRAIAKHFGRSDEALKPISVNDITLRAPRPIFAALSNEKLAQAGFAMPDWRDAIGRYLAAPAQA